MVIVTYWVLCGIACGVIASSKGHSGLAGLVVGCLLNILGLIIIAAMPSQSTADARS